MVPLARKKGWEWVLKRILERVTSARTPQGSEGHVTSLGIRPWWWLEELEPLGRRVTPKSGPGAHHKIAPHPKPKSGDDGAMAGGKR